MYKELFVKKDMINDVLVELNEIFRPSGNGGQNDLSPMGE